MEAPRLELYSREMLLALCQQALGAGPVSAEGLPGAPELLRRIEQTQARLTEALKQSSEARASLGILSDKLAEARRRVQTACADVNIHDRDSPPPHKRRLFGPKPTKEQAAHRKQREALAAKLKEAEAALASLETEQQRVSAAFDGAQKLRQAAEQERLGWISSLQLRLAQEVICALMPGGAGGRAAQDLLEQARRIVRGDPVVGVVSVLAALFGAESRTQGAHGARDMLGNLRGLFEQHPGPYERVLLAFIALVASGGEQRPSLAEIGIYRPDDFASTGLFSFYLLTRALGGLNFDPPRALLSDRFGKVLELVAGCIGDSSTQPSLLPEESAHSPSLPESVLYSNLLLAAGRQAEIPAAIGIDLAALPAPKQRGGNYPALLGLCDKLPSPAWPAETLALWRSLLALHLLCAARSLPLGGAYAQWLDESYGWPKSAFYWRTLAWLKDDESLLRNIAEASWPVI